MPQSDCCTGHESSTKSRRYREVYSVHWLPTGADMAGHGAMALQTRDKKIKDDA